MFGRTSAVASSPSSTSYLTQPRYVSGLLYRPSGGVSARLGPPLTLSDLLRLNAQLTDASPRSEQPPDAAIPLKVHQLALLQRCVELELGQVPPDMMGAAPAGQGGGVSPASVSRHASGVLTTAITLDGQSGVTMRTRMGIMADRAGSGKSFVILSLVLRDAAKRRDDPIAQVVRVTMDPLAIPLGNGQVTVYAPQPERTLLPFTLIVIPHTLVAQWREYVARFSPSLSMLVINRRAHMAMLRDLDALRTFDIVLVTNTMYPDVVQRLAISNVRVRRAVYDEADSLSITSIHSVDAMFTWYVTASYGNLIYPRGPTAPGALSSSMLLEVLRDQSAQSIQGLRASSGAMRTLFNHLSTRNNVTRSLIVRNSDEFVAASIELPETLVHRVVCRDPAHIRMLQGVVDTQVIECLNAGDVTGAIQHVDPTQRTSSEENLVILLLDRLGARLRNLDIRIAALASLESEGGHRPALTELARLRNEREDVSRRMKVVRERIKASDTCCICCDDMTNKTVVPCCSNAFCFKCITRWMVTREAATCPLCKVDLNRGDLLVLDPSASASGPDGDALAAAVAATVRADGCGDAVAVADVAVTVATLTCPTHIIARLHLRRATLTKMHALENILTYRRIDPQAKFLIFSSNENTFMGDAGVMRVLDKVGLRHAQLKGNGQHVVNVMNNYRGSTLDALLVNTTHYGNGLNLENTSDVILFHKLGAEIEHQVIGRAMRMGRTAPLNVWYLLHEQEARSDAASVAASVASAASAASSSQSSQSSQPAAHAAHAAHASGA